jgi:hypothetical protein
MNVAGQLEDPAVPGRSGLRFHLVVGDEIPIGEVLEESGDIISKESDVHVKVGPGDAAKPGINCPAAAKCPRTFERRHEAGGVHHRLRDWFNRRQEELQARSAQKTAPRRNGEDLWRKCAKRKTWTGAGS